MVTNRSEVIPRRPAFILLSGFGVIGRNALYVRELKQRGLSVLLITPASWRDELLRRMKEPGHVASHLSEVSFAHGTLGQPESFTYDVIAQVMRWRDDYEIRGAFAVGEILVEQTAIVADALGLPHPGLRASRVCRSKALQRWYLREWSPVSRVVTPDARDALTDSSISFPAVVKPVSRHSSSGVRSYRSMEALRRDIRSYPDYETLLIEDQVTGQEFSVESLVQSGEVIFDSVTCKQTTESHASTFVELSHSVPSPPSDVNKMLIEQSRAVLRCLDFGDGIAHSEWRVTPDGRPFLMEIAARTPGDGLMPLYGLATGRPLEPEIVRICLGEPASYPAASRFARQVYLEHPAGRLDNVRVGFPGVPVAWVGKSGEWPQLRPCAPADPPALHAVLVLHRQGDTLSALADSDDRAVTFFIDAPTPGLLDAQEACARSAIRVDVTP